MRQEVLKRAKEKCEYCLSQSDLLGAELEIEHIIPESLNGTSSLDNLCASCATCNRHKGSRIWAIDPETGRNVRLFHPRQQRWNRHFRWSEDGTRIIGKTICGRATVEAWQMNRQRLVRARRLWMAWGEHPPPA
ncbi:HNH endonuclease [Candidatus Poribacteria bacterium]|nr:HNH endonuclease [Candidatus Poribacteria bacterium]